MRAHLTSLAISFASIALLLAACRGPEDPGKQLAGDPVSLQTQVAGLLRDHLRYARLHEGDLPYSGIQLRQPMAVSALYGSDPSRSLWCERENWLPAGDSLLRFLQEAPSWGLFPEDYHGATLDSIRSRMEADSLGRSDRRDARQWAQADVLLTDAFASIVHDLYRGRLPSDSVTLRKDTLLADSFYVSQWKELQEGGSLRNVLSALEPAHPGYLALKSALPRFLASMDTLPHTKVPFPIKDSALYRQALAARLREGGYLDSLPLQPDSAGLTRAVKKFQQDHQLTVDGKAGEGTVRMLNLDDRDKRVRIALTMDKYKMLPAHMPDRYILVNIPANLLQVMEDGKPVLESKVITGKPLTRTPLLNSAVSTLITYPQWIPPPSIVLKEILPSVKKNPGYLARKGFSLLDKDGEEVDPYSVDWSQYSKSIPYRIVQGSGDANALGIMKFHFDNKYSVYLHDTNQRFLFGNAYRWLSHGCVRVQEWEKLALYLLRNERKDDGGQVKRRTDSLYKWLREKEKHNLVLERKMPVFIRYFTCAASGNDIQFFDDVYGDDRRLRERYFAGK